MSARFHRRLIVGSLAAVLAVALAATPAGAHASFVNALTGYPVNTDQDLRLFVPHERDDTTFNTDVVVAMGAGWAPVSCKAKATWSCATGVDSGRQVIHFSKAAGALPAEDEYFEFRVHTAPVAGTVSFPTVQTYNTGEVVRWAGGPGSDEPAPVLTTLPPGETPQTTAPTTSIPHRDTVAPAPPSPGGGAPGGPVTPAPSVRPGPAPVIPGGPTTTAAPAIAPTTVAETAAGTTPDGTVPTQGDAGTTVPGTAPGSTVPPRFVASTGSGGAPASTSGSGAGPWIAVGVVIVLAALGGGLYLRSRPRPSSA